VPDIRISGPINLHLLSFLRFQKWWFSFCESIFSRNYTDETVEIFDGISGTDCNLLSFASRKQIFSLVLNRKHSHFIN
jgi:hypothetical protein